ncbi:TIGR03086 family metal-binding protein [Actinokineospora sp. HUAS TT18]|uniref:TIGR03086 family metal-binding protein n=1 Tax=Actinokineospora sp. HUAS TT18 TaxID=3447451 RepID=UPI003F51CE23
MDKQTVMERAAAGVLAVVGNVKPDMYDRPTPCADWDVRTLANHLTHWSAVVSERAARKQPVPSDGSEAEGTDYTAEADWPGFFADRLDRAVKAWGAPGAWDGETVLASDPRQADFIGKMLYGELVLHGWDLARATGQDLAIDPDVAEAALVDAEEIADMAREWTAFGPEVKVGADASTVDRLLAVSGRDPEWRP